MQNPELLLFGLAALLTAIGVLIFRFLPKSKTREVPAATPTSPEAVVSAQAPIAAAPTETPEKTLKQALSATEKNIWGRLKSFVGNDDIKAGLEQVEEVLYTSDLGPKTVQLVMGALEDELSTKQKGNLDLVKQTLKTQFLKIFSEAHIEEPGAKVFSHLQLSQKPSVWLVVGVNGAGKTTSIGKLASRLAAEGHKVLVAAGDTFRAAAGSQLQVWTERAQVEIFSPPGVSDPSAVAFDAIAKSKAQGYDVVLIDTAGRLHTQSGLMDELKKLKRVMSKVIPDAPHETLIVLDANSGQNALQQAREFHAALGLTGVILTKMDGTAKGGVAVGLAHELKIPIRLIGVGEKIQDLRAFSSQEFVESIFVDSTPEGRL